MDHFGIGAALQGAARVYFQGARRTGRTTSLLDSLRGGDRIVCASRQEARSMEQLCHERKLKVECIVVAPSGLDRLIERGTSQGRTLFDHGFVEQYYAQALERAAQGIDYFQREASGFGAAHIETRRQAEELARWRS
jgi:hypothetical protein